MLTVPEPTRNPVAQRRLQFDSLSPSARTVSQIFLKGQPIFTHLANLVTSSASKLHDSNFWGNQKNREVSNLLRYLGLRDRLPRRPGAPALLPRPPLPR